MFEATEVERKTREINLLIDMQRNLSSCRTSDHYFFLSLQQLSWDSLRTKNVSSVHSQNYCKVNICGQKRSRNRIMYILLKWCKLARWAGRRIKSFEHNDWF